MVILTIVMAVIVPSVLGFIWHGQQISRMNVARSIYVSMQNQLTRHLLEGNLKEVLTGPMYYGYEAGELEIDGDYYRIKDEYRIFNVERQLIENQLAYPATDEENAPYVFYVQIPRDFNPDPDDDDEINEVQKLFYKLLDEVIIDKDILNSAFLMEFNIRTGVILSIFYGDNTRDNSARSRQASFGYGPEFTPGLMLFNWGDGNIAGQRGMDGSIAPYEFAFTRWQGYYGVDWTGEPWDIPLPDAVNIFDGTNKPLEGRENVLYAELYVPRNRDLYGIESYTLELVDNRGNSFAGFEPITVSTDTFALSNALGVPQLQTTLSAQLFTYSGNGELIYFPEQSNKEVNLFGVDLSDSYDLFIWVLDCVYGSYDQEFDNFVRIHRYSMFDGIYSDANPAYDPEDPDSVHPPAKPQFIRAKLSRVDADGPGISTISLRSDHSHFGGELPDDRYELKSGRHLNNIRYSPEASFVQSTTIDLTADGMYGGVVEGAIINFEPIANFSGTFIALGPQRILNLIIVCNADTTDPDIVEGESIQYVNVGLFASTTGTITGVSLHNADISATGSAHTNVGAIAGRLNPGGTISQSYSFANVKRNSTPESNTGGLAGYNAGGLIDQSFTAGFYNTNRINAEGDLRTYYWEGTGSVNAGAGSIGGLAGRNSGTIRNSFNNARVNINNVSAIEVFVEVTVNGFEREFLLSVTDVPDAFYPLIPGSASTPFLGGIVGFNESGGVIERTYATNHVAIYDIPADSGGIAGRNDGSVNDSLYLVNGCDNNIGSPVSKSDLIDSLGILGSLFQESDVDADLYLEEREGWNDYINYPYPTLRNNPILDSGFWGWEEIRGEDIISLGALVYYEFYTEFVTDTQINLHRRYNSPFIAPPSRIIPGNSTEALTWFVHHDGYAIEFYPNSEGYLMQFGESAPGVPVYYRIVELINPAGEAQWRVVAFGSAGNVPDPAWLPAEAFRPTAGLEPELIADPDTLMFRIYIPNELALEQTNSQIKVALFLGTSPDDNENILSTVDQENITEYSPWFANSTQGTAANPGIIRSARHFDNINLAVSGASIIGTYNQHLNIDFGLDYFNGLETRTGGQFSVDIKSDTIRTFNNRAVVYRASFAGVYSGSMRFIANLTINTYEDNAGLFGINNGIIENVTLRNQSITGGEYVGAVAGSNNSNGIIRNISVQQAVIPIGTESRYHSITVTGRDHVGGIVGHNSGTLINAAIVSTKARPFVSATTVTANTGGMIGSNAAGATANWLMYLAVSPVQGTGGADTRLHPFTGTGTVGPDVTYLGGPRALRPYLNTFETDVVAAAAQTAYNTRPPVSDLGVMQVTYGMYTSNLWTGWQRIPGLTQILAESLANTVYPYPYPSNTVAPALYPLNAVPPPAPVPTWPIVVQPPPVMENVIYYEKYENGTSGIYVKGMLRDQNGAIILDPDGNPFFETLVDYLDPNGVVVEAGYAFAPRDAVIGQGNSSMWISHTGTSGSWYLRRFTAAEMPVLEVSDLPGLSGYDQYRVIMFNLLTDYYTGAGRDPGGLVYLAFTQGGGNNPGLTNVAVALNPFFAKEIYSVTVDGNSTVPANRRPPQPTEFYVHTPWHMQNISRINEYIGVGGVRSVAYYSRFIQDRQLSFSSTLLTEPQVLVTPQGVMVQRGIGYEVFFSTRTPQTTIADQYNATTAIVNNGTATVGTGAAAIPPTSNIIRGNFAGTFNGNYRTISNLSLTNAATAPAAAPPQNNKGLFSTISGTVDGVTLIGFSLANGSNNGGLASTVSAGGLVNNVVVRNYVSTGAGFIISGAANTAGLVSANSGTIQNVTMIGSTISGIDAGSAGVVSINNASGLIRDISFIDNRAATDTVTPSSLISGATVAGIVNNNLGRAENILFIARAPGINPITATTGAGSTVSNAFYLSGAINGLGEPIDFNNYSAAAGTPATTQEINALNRDALTNLGFGASWVQSTVPATANTIISATYPYPFFPNTSAGISAWPVATIGVHGIAYYERYADGSTGFFSPDLSGLPALNDTLAVLEAGYCVIVPRAGGYSIKTGEAGLNTHLQATASGSVNFVIIPPGVVSGASSEIYVNDQATGMYISTYFARAVYTSPDAATNPATVLFLRTPQQLQNIGLWTGAAINRTIGVTFTQDRNMNFASDVGGAAFIPVTGVFEGTYNGNGYSITNPAINVPTPYVGMFGNNAGTISNLTFNLNGTNITGVSANASIGAVAGVNSGTISGITLNLSGTSRITGDGTGASVGGIVGLNSGTVSGILAVFNGQSSVSASGAGAFTGGIAGTSIGAGAVIRDLTIVSTLFIEDASVYIAVSPISGGQAGGVAGDNSGTITRALFLAPAPMNSTRDEIYPMVYQNAGTANITAAYFLAGTDSLIVNTDGEIVPLGDIPSSYGYDFDEAQYSNGVPLNSRGIINAVFSNLSGWSGWTASPPPSDFTPPTPPPVPYPYPVFTGLNTPLSWPVVLVEPVLTLRSAALMTEENPETEESLEGEKDPEEDSEPEGIPEDDENSEPEEINPTEAMEGILITTGVITLFGGYGFTKTEPFKSLIRRSNARAIRRINEYNDKKRR